MERERHVSMILEVIERKFGTEHSDHLYDLIDDVLYEYAREIRAEYKGYPTERDEEYRRMVLDRVALTTPAEALEALSFLRGDDEALMRMNTMRDKRYIREQLISIGQAQWEDVAEKTEKIYASLSLRH